MNETELRDLIARTAEQDAQSGKIYEWSDDLKGLIELYNSYPNIGRGIKYSPALGGWCMLYISTLFIQNGLGDIIQPEIGAYEPMKNAQAAGLWRSRKSGYKPRRGDIIHYAFPRTNEKGETFTQYHVGMITNSGINGAGQSVIYTTEGNVEKRVLMRANLNWEDNKEICGFILPDYEKAVTEIKIPDLPDKTGVYILKGYVNGFSNYVEWSKEK